MPYLRLFVRDLPIQQKRAIAQELIEITLRTFKLSPDQRYQTSVQFITIPYSPEVDGLQTAIPCEADLTLEVIGHDLAEESKKEFAQEAAAMLTPIVPLGTKGKSPQQITLQFNELWPNVCDAVVPDTQPWAA